MAQSKTKELKIVTCVAHLLFFCGLAISSCFISHLSPQLEEYRQ